MALMDLKSDLSFYGKKGQAMNYKPNRDKTDTNFSSDGLSTSNVLVYDNESKLFSRRQLQAADSFLIDDVTYSGRGFASRNTQLGAGSKFPIGPEGQIHEFDKVRIGFTPESKYGDQYGVKFKKAGLANTYTTNSPIDDMYNKFNLRDDATPNSYIKHPLILRGIQRDGSSDPQHWGINVGPGLSGAFDIPRGGILTATNRTLIDTARIGKFLASPKGIGFLAKQVGYQLMNPKAETRIYNPLSLGSLAPIVHINRHAGASNALIGGLVSELTKTDLHASLRKNLFKNFDGNSSNNSISIGSQISQLSSKIGGPGSVLGIGGTIIRRYEDTSLATQLIGTRAGTLTEINAILNRLFPNLPADYVYHRYSYEKPFITKQDATESSNEIKSEFGETEVTRPFKGPKGGGIAKNTEKEKGLDYTLLPYNDIPVRPIGTTAIIRTKDGKSESYEGKSNFGTNLELLNKIDKDPEKSLIDFKFKSDDHEVILKAYLGTLSDQFAPSWEGTADQGRADSRYQYSAFERSISLDFKVVAEQGKSGDTASPDGFKAIWNKLQNLGRMTHPVYGSEGFYGQKVDVTIGKLFNATPMIITDLGFDWDNETPWEIDPDYQSPLYTNVIMSCIVLGKKRPQNDNKLYDITGLE
tara:strand:- start:28625 stop:30547 length:1923 start_codon:yes stop_codon:yes gene_type:complete